MIWFGIIYCPIRVQRDNRDGKRDGFGGLEREREGGKSGGNHMEMPPEWVRWGDTVKTA